MFWLRLCCLRRRILRVRAGRWSLDRRLVGCLLRLRRWWVLVGIEVKMEILSLTRRRSGLCRLGR